MCLKKYDVGHWPSLLFENHVSLTPFKWPAFAERIAMSPLMHTTYCLLDIMFVVNIIVLKVNVLGILQPFLISRY